MDFLATEIGGHLNCINNKLTSLRGCPANLGGDLRCSGNKLTTLEYCPKRIDGDFSFWNNKLTTLKFFPSIIAGSYHVDLKHQNLPEGLGLILRLLDSDQKYIFFKYQNEYDVWEPEFDFDKASELVTDIRDGLE